MLFASPTVAVIIKPPPGVEQFSVIYILGSSHTFDNIPFNIKSGAVYSVFLGVENQMGSPIYYTCSVKLASDSDILPDPTVGTSSPLPSLYEYKTIVADSGTWEAPLTFQINKIDFANNASTVSDLNINGVDFPVNKISGWDPSKSGYYYTLFVELSIYNSTLNSINYNGRFVSLKLNMTQ